MNARAWFPALRLLADACQSAGPVQTPDPNAYRTTLSCSATLQDVPESARVVRAWIPLPRSNAFQTIANLRIEPQGTLRRDPTYGNALAFVEWKSPFRFPLQVTLTYDLRRREEGAHAESTPPALMRRYLQPDRLGIIDDRVRAMARRATAGRTGTMARARGIYDFVLAHMTYAKDIPGWGRGDTARACDVGRGNCSDFHALFISLARAASIPARFHYGLMLKPGGKAGPHCWAAFHDADRGWVPVDISEADKDPSRTDTCFGRLSKNRVEVTTGRDIVLEPRQAGDPLNFFISPYVEVDGRPHHKVRLDLHHTGRR